MHELKNQIIENNYVILCDCFLSNKYNSLVLLFNNPLDIKLKTNIDVENIKFKLNGIDIILERTIFNNWNHKEEENLHNSIYNTNEYFYGYLQYLLFKKNVYSDDCKIYKLEININDTIFIFNLDPPINDFCSKNCVTTLFKNDYDLINNWIKYNKLLGFEKFIIYDNSSTNILEIEDDDVIIIHANWNYFTTREEPGKTPVGQIIQQNHCIWKYMPYFLALIDLDEYINPHNNYNLFNLNNPIVSIPNYWFIANDRIKFNLKESTLREIHDNEHSQRKCIIIPKYVDYFVIHTAFSFTSNIIYLKHNQVQLNHYYNLGNKKRKWRKMLKKDDSILKILNNV